MNCATGRGREEILRRDSPAFLSLPRILTKCAGDKDGRPCLPAAQSDPALRRALNLKRWLLTASHPPAPDSWINAINFDGCGPVCSVAAAGSVVLFFIFSFAGVENNGTSAANQQTAALWEDSSLICLKSAEKQDAFGGREGREEGGFSSEDLKRGENLL